MGQVGWGWSVEARYYKRRVSTADGKIKSLAGGNDRGAIANTGDGDGGSAAVAKLYSPYGVAVDANGMVYVSDRLGQRVRRFPFAGGTINTIAGNGTPGFAGDGGAGTSARFYGPRGLNIGDNNSLLIADRDNQRIRELSASGTLTTFAGRTQYGGENGPAVDATLFQPPSLA